MISTKMISKSHSNRRSYNWHAYDIGDQLLNKKTKHYKGFLYDLGADDPPYKDFFLQHAKQYVAVDWAGNLHNTKADIAADLNKPLPIASEVEDAVVSLSVMVHLNESHTMLIEAFRIMKAGG